MIQIELYFKGNGHIFTYNLYSDSKLSGKAERSRKKLNLSGQIWVSLS